MKTIFRKGWVVFTWAAFSVGVVTSLLIIWSKIWPYVNKKYFESSPSLEINTNISAAKAQSRIHPEFIQNLNNHLSEIDSNDSVSALAYSPQRDFFLVGYESGNVEIWDGRQANTRRGIKAHKMRASLSTFSSDGQVFFTTSTFDTFTNVWETASGQLLHSIQNVRGPLIETSDTNFFVIAGSAELRIFDLKNRQLLPETYKMTSGVVTAITYDPATNRIAIGTASGELEIWQFSKGSQGSPWLEQIASVHPYAMGNWVIGLAFVNNGNLLYSIPQRGLVDAWSTHPMEKLRSHQSSLKFESSPIFIPEQGLLTRVGFVSDETYPSFLEILNLKTDSKSVINMLEGGLGPIAYLPSLSTVIAVNGRSMSVIDISKAR